MIGTQKRTALLVGATGMVGGHCLQFLLNDDAYDSVIVLLRREIRLKNAKLHLHSINFDHLNECAAIIKANDVFCCLGITIKKAGSQANFRKVDFEYPYNIARIALDNGAQQFLFVTAIGANKSSLIFYNRIKGEVEEVIKNLPYKTVHIFRPSLLLGERTEKRTGEKIGTVLYTISSPLFVGPLRKYKAIKGKSVAGAMVICAKKNQKGIFVHESNEIQRIFDNAHESRC